jgi:hypothetical protein
MLPLRARSPSPSSPSVSVSVMVLPAMRAPPNGYQCGCGSSRVQRHADHAVRQRHAWRRRFAHEGDGVRGDGGELPAAAGG